MSENSGYSQTRLTELVTALMMSHRFAHVKAAKLPCFLPCDPIENFAPDATGYAGGAFIIAKTESRIQLSDPAVWKRWTAFHHHASRLDRHFVVAVNKMEEDNAWCLLENICGEAGNVHVWAF